MGAIFAFVKARLVEKTTWAGLFIFAMNMTGIQVGETQIENLALSAAGLAAAIMALTPEKKAE